MMLHGANFTDMDENTTENMAPEPDSEVYLMRMCTSQAMRFKTLFDVLKDLLTEVNIRFDKEGFKVISLDPGKIGMIYLSVYNIDSYFCTDTMYTGVYVNYIYKIIRTVTMGHYLEWRIRKDDPGVLEMVLTHAERRICTTHRIKTLVLDVEEITIPSVEFDCVVTIPSGDFQKYIKELSHVANMVEITTEENKVCLSCKGDMGKTCIEIAPTPSGLNWIFRRDETITFNGTYFIKYLERFSRGQVDSKVELFLKQDYPLILKYQMTIGALRFCIAPIINTSNSV
jgi:proliferating cell nuclear antigen